MWASRLAEEQTSRPGGERKSEDGREGTEVVEEEEMKRLRRCYGDRARSSFHLPGIVCTGAARLPSKSGTSERGPGRAWGGEAPTLPSFLPRALLAARRPLAILLTNSVTRGSPQEPPCSSRSFRLQTPASPSPPSALPQSAGRRRRLPNRAVGAPRRARRQC